MEPPQYKEGAGGGAAFPVDIGMSADEKAFWGDVALFSGGMAAVSTVLAGVATGAGAAPVAAVWTVAAGVWALDAVLATALADDPPQPAYQRIVEFRPRVCTPPGLGDPALAPLGIAAQRGLFLTVTGRGYLDAVERLQGAQAAQDLNWALVHRGVADQARWGLAVDLATCAAALHAAGGALAGSPHDAALTPGVGGGKAWIETPQAREAATRQLRRAGLTAAETDATLAYFRTDPVYDGPAGPVSAELTARGTALHALATRLAA
jgi:hypothetical protein